MDTILTPEEIDSARALNWPQSGSGFTLDPATGALIVSPTLDRKVRKALRREARRMVCHLYLTKAQLDAESLWLKGKRALLHLAERFSRNFFQSVAD